MDALAAVGPGPDPVSGHLVAAREACRVREAGSPIGRQVALSSVDPTAWSERDRRVVRRAALDGRVFALGGPAADRLEARWGIRPPPPLPTLEGAAPTGDFAPLARAPDGQLALDGTPCRWEPPFWEVAGADCVVAFDDPTPRRPLAAEVPVLALRWPAVAHEPVVHRFTWSAETVAAFLVDWSARAGAPRASLEEACATLDPAVVRATLARVAPRTVATPEAAAFEDALVWCPALP